MKTRDLHLAELYQTPRDPAHHALAARHAPLLRFDQNEPFLPLAAGYTIFEADGPSPSMNRAIHLQPAGLPAARRAIEYAIWWDWDIHHLYELEHVWMYLDAQDQPIWLEASWHGGYNPMPLVTQAGRAVVFSEPGKHAFAPGPEWFRKRAAQVRRIETQDLSSHAGVLINQFNGGKVRRRVSDSNLVRSYLLQHAFQPAWDFSRQFVFAPESLVPWPDLLAWIPGRMNRWLERLECTVRPEAYRALWLANGGSNAGSLQAAAAAKADLVMLSVHAPDGVLRLGPELQGLPLAHAFDFLFTEPMGALLEPDGIESLDLLAAFIREKKVQNYAIIVSADIHLLQRYHSLVSGGKTAVRLSSPNQDPLQTAQESGAIFALLAENPGPEQASAWIDPLHQAGLGIACAPVQTLSERDSLQKLGFDIVWQPNPGAVPPAASPIEPELP